MATRNKKNPSESLVSALAAMNRAYRQRSEAYDRFVESIEGKASRARADAWMAYNAQDIQTYGDQESLVYLRSRGSDCAAEPIDKLVESWKDAAEEMLERCTRGHIMVSFPSGRSKRIGAIPRAQAKEVKNMSSYVLHNFWGGHDSQEHFIDATMLRTVEWCEIGGFDEWWDRLARDYQESIIQGGFDAASGSFWLFAMCRSDYTIELMGGTLRRALEALELPVDNNPPWRVLREIFSKTRRTHRVVDHLSIASTIIFANARLGAIDGDKPLPRHAAVELLKAQDRQGGWKHWADDQTPSIEATAMCIHGLAEGKPRGWERAISKAAQWLWSKQSLSGCWTEPSCPDPVYLSVLVLDALDIAAGGSQLTFGTSATLRKAGTNSRRFRVALSFPGELRPVVDKVARALAAKLGREKVFYDRFFEDELARPDLDTYIQKLYHDDTDLIVAFLGADYVRKEWCGLEWRALRDLIKKNRGPDIMLLKIDSVELSNIPGIYSIDGYVDVRNRAPSKIATSVLQRLARHRGSGGEPSEPRS